MTEKEVQKLSNGLYRIYWDDGGTSVAAVGRNHQGKCWLAPTNWLSILNPEFETSFENTWSGVDRVELIASE